MTSNPKQHLNPLSMIYFLFRHLLDWVILIALVFGPAMRFLVRHHISPLLGFGGIILLIIAIVFVRYLCFTFEIADDMLTINSGIFIKKHTHIPYGRIQTIQRSQWFFLKPFHLEKLQIETAGHDDHSPEAVLPIVPERVREAIEQRRVSHHANPDSDLESTIKSTQANSKPIPTYLINPHDLNVFALTSLGIFPLMGVLLAIYGKIQDVIPQRIINSITSEIVQQSILMIVIIALLIIIISIIGTFLTIVQRYYKFTLTNESGQLKTYQGLFQRNSVTIPVNRIQAIRIKQNIIRQWCKLSTIQALSASSAGDKEKSNDLMIIPVIKTAKVFSSLAPFISWAPADFSQLTPLPKRDFWYFIRNALLFGLVPVAICLYFFKAWGLLSLPIFIIAFFQGWYSASNTGWKISGDQLIMQNGHWFTRSQFVIPRKNVQSFGIHQSIWMTRTNLAHVRVNVRHGNSNEEVELRYLPLSAAQEIFNWLKIRK